MTALVLLSQEIKTCTNCVLAEIRTHAVPGEGNPASPIMLVGEAPGATEDETGRPFVGQAGRLLDEFLSRADLSRSQFFITNIVKCRPPNNINPPDDIIKACEPYLKAQTDIIKPRLIVPMGNVATRYYLGPTKSISRVRGSLVTKRKQTYYPMFHPAYLLRSRARHKGSPWWHTEQDFAHLKKMLQEFAHG